jgi:serine/threonine protein kinase
LTFFATREASEVLAARRAANVSLGGTGTLERSGSGAMRDPRDTRRLSTHDTLGSSRAATTPMQRNFSFLGSAGATQPRTTPHGVIAPVVVNMGSACVYRSRTPPGLMTRGNNATADGDSLATTAPGKTFTAAAIMNDLNLTGPTLRDRCIYRYAKKQVLARGAFGETYIGERRDGPASIAVNGVLNAANAATTAAEQLVAATFASDEATTSNNAPILRTGSSMSPSLATTPNGGPVPLLQRGNSGGRFVTQQEEASSSAAATAQQLQIVPQQQLHGDAHPDRYSPARMAVMRRPIKHPSIQVPSMAHDASTALSCSVSTAPVQVGGQSASMDVDTADQTSLGPGTASSRGGASTSVVRERVAIKTLFAKKFSSSDRKFIQEEIACLSTCSHPNICGFVDCFERNSEISIVLELCDGSDLAHHITQRSQSGRPMPFQESEAMQIFAQACLAVEYLHRHNILHRDLKAANFMYAANIGLVKLIDFGFAKRYPTSVTADDKPPTGANADPNRVQQGVDQSFVGTPYCIAPEMWGGRPYAHKLDVWALGVLLFELLALQLPFAGRDLDHLAKNIVNNARSCDLPHNVSKAVDQLVRDLLAHDPANRPSLTSILHRPAMRFAVRSAYDKLKRQNALSEVQRCMFQQHVIAIYGGDEILTLPRLMIPRSGLTNIAQYVGNSAVHSDRGGVDPSMRSRSSESGSNSASPYAGMPSATSASFPRTGSGGGGGGGLGGGGIGSDGDPARARVVPPPLPKLDIQPNGAAALVIPPMPPGDGSTTDPEAPQFSSITFIMRATAVPPRALLAAEAYVEALDDQTVLSLIFADVLPLAFANHLYSGGSSAAAAASHPLAAAPLSANLTWWTAALMDFASETTSRPVGSKRPRPHPAASPSPQQHRDGDADTLRSSSHSPMPVGGTPVTAAVVNRLVGRVGTPSARWVPHAALLTDSELILIPMKRARRALAQYVLPRLALHLVRSTKIMDEVRALLKGPTTTPNPEMPHPTAPSVANSSQYHNPQHGLAVSARSSLRLQGPPPGAGALPPPQSQPAAAAATTTTANDITATETGTMHSGSSGNGSGNGGQRTAGSPVGNSNSKAVAPRRPISFLEFAASLYVFELPPEAKRDIQSSPRHIASTLVDDNYQRSFEATLWSFAIQRADTALRHPGCVRSPVGSGGFRRGGVTPTHAPSSPSGASFTSTSEGGAPSVSNPLQQATVANRRLSPQQPGVGPRSAHYAAGPRAGVGAVTNAVTTDSAAAVHALQFSLLFFALRGAMTVVPKPPRRFGGPSSITRPPKMKLLRYGHPDDFPPLPAIAPATVTPPGTATPPITFPLRRPAQAAATVAARPLAPTSPHYTLAGYTRFELIPTPPPPAPAPWFEAAVMPSHSSDSPSTSAVTAAGLRQQQTPQSLDSGVQHPQPQPTQGIEPKLPTASSVGGGASALSAISPAVATTSTASTATPAPGSGAGLAGPADSQPVCRASASDAVPVVVGAAPSNGDVRSGGVQHFPEYARPVVISPAVGGKSSSAPQSVCGAVAPTYPFSVAHDLPATIVWLALPAECASATSCLTPTAAAIAAEHALPPLSAGAPPAASPAARPFPPAVGECVGIELTPSAAAAAAVMGTRLPTAAGAASAGPAASGRGVAQGLLASNMEARLRQLCAGLRDWNGM